MTLTLGEDSLESHPLARNLRYRSKRDIGWVTSQEDGLFSHGARWHCERLLKPQLDFFGRTFCRSLVGGHRELWNSFWRRVRVSRCSISTVSWRTNT